MENTKRDGIGEYNVGMILESTIWDDAGEYNGGWYWRVQWGMVLESTMGEW